MFQNWKLVTMRNRSIFGFILCCIMLRADQAIADGIMDWLEWRGPGAGGAVLEGSYPSSLSETQIAWKTELPGKGCSTPIVHGQNIYLTVPVEGKDAVLSIDSDGSHLWTTTFGPEDPGKHANASGSNSSPVTDGQAIFVYFKSGTLASLDMSGTIRWRINITQKFGKEKMFWDYGSSPVLTERFVILVRMHDGDSWLAAFDKETGELAWKVDRNYSTPVENDQCYTTPVVFDFHGRESILVWGAEHVTINDATDGRLVWSSGGFNPEGNRLWPAIASPIIVDDVVVVAHGRADRQDPRLFGVDLKGPGDGSSAARLWSRTDVGTFVPTPAVWGDNVIVLGDLGEVECLDPITGRTLWKDRLPRHRAKYYASPLVAGSMLYLFREDGGYFVSAIDDQRMRLVSQGELNLSIIGSPIPFGNGLLVRGDTHLICFRTEL
jgi:outer membrane protein assembly factor BamB